MRVNSVPAVAFLAFILSGCFGPEVGPSVEKLGPGHCQRQGVMDVQIVGFNRTQDATLYLRIENHFTGRLGYDQDLFIQTIGDRITYMASLRNDSWPNEPYEDLKTGEAVTEAVRLGEVTNATWRRLVFDYDYGARALRDGYPYEFACSLKGDNAPWAFVDGGT